MLRNMLPALAGLGLAVLVVLLLIAGFSFSSPGSPHSKPTARSYEALVGSAAVHWAGAQHLVHSASHLKNEARQAHLKAAKLELQLADLLKKESARDQIAEKAAAVAKDLGDKARAQALKAGSMKVARAQALKAAEIKRRAFLKDEKLAAEDKEQAKDLLDQERELFQKSFSRISTEANSQERMSAEEKKLKALKSEQEQTQDKLAILEMRKRQMLHDAAEKKAMEAKKAAKQKALQKLGLTEDQHTEIKKGVKRPLWGKRRWPSYYKNVLASKHAFKADAPTKPPRMLDAGDDDAPIAPRHDHPQYVRPQRCDMNHPCNQMEKKEALLAALREEAAQERNAGFKLAGERHEAETKTQEAFSKNLESVLKKFQGDVARLEKPMQDMSAKLEQSVADHSTQKKFIVEPGMLDGQAKDLVEDMQNELSSVEEQMRDDEAEKTKILEKELGEMAEAMKSSKHETQGANEKHIMEAAEAREEDVKRAMEQAREDTEKKLGAMQNEIEQFAKAQEAEEQRVTGQAAAYAASEAKAFEEAEIKMRKARMAAKQAMQAERVKASAKTQERVSSAIKAVQSAAERGMAVFKDKLEGERQQVQGLREEVAKLQERQQEDSIVKSAEKRVKSRMQNQMKKLVHEDHDRETRMMNQILAEKKEELKLIREGADRKAKDAVEQQKLRDSQELSAEKTELQHERAMTARFQSEAASANRMLAEENQALAHSKKIEAEMLTEAKEARAAAEAAHTAEVKKESAARKQKPAVNPLEPPKPKPVQKTRTLDLKEFQTAVSSQVKQQIRGFERAEEQKEHEAVRKVERAAAEKTRRMEAKLDRVQNTLHREQARRERKQENLLGSLGAVGGEHLNLAHSSSQRSPVKAARPDLQTHARAEKGIETRTANHRANRDVDHAHRRPANPQALAEAKALGFGSVGQFEHHVKHARDSDEFSKFLGLGPSTEQQARPAHQNDAYLRLEDEMVKASRTHQPPSKGFFNSGLVADNVVPVLSAQSASQATL